MVVLNGLIAAFRLTSRHSWLSQTRTWRNWASPPLEPAGKCCSPSQVQMKKSMPLLRCIFHIAPRPWVPTHERLCPGASSCHAHPCCAGSHKLAYVFHYCFLFCLSLQQAQVEPSCAEGNECAPADRGHPHCQPLDLKAIGGPYYWQTSREVQGNTVVIYRYKKK